MTSSTCTATATATATATTATAGQKRSAPTGSAANAAGFRPVKRRASKACQCCRARKVRCNVVEHGAPCTNCRLDEVECIITESKRRKKNWGLKIDGAPGPDDTAATYGRQSFSAHEHVEFERSHAHSHSHSLPHAPAHVHAHSTSPPALSMDGHSDKEGGHVPHFIYQTQARRASFASSHASLPSLTTSRSAQSSTSSSFPRRVSAAVPSVELAPFIKPTPARIPPEDVHYLWSKGALSLPDEPLRSDLLRAHFDFTHPFMPLLDRTLFMQAVTSPDGSKGRVGMLLFQAVMFSGSAFVDMDVLRAAGFTSRKAARKAFFTKARLLYDFDHEQDRMVLVQALLLMTYWYETPDDQKDTWHWMGVAISLSHTIGLHRNPEKSTMDPRRQKLWKRIWWSCFMRDRLVALGMRRPTRIKDEDCDVPMLTLDDFSIDSVLEGEDGLMWTYEERRQREKEAARQRELALMCIEKAKLCQCISNVLGVQYSVLNTNHGSTTADGSPRTTMMLLPKKLDPGCLEVQRCDEDLEKWIRELPQEVVYRAGSLGGSVDPVLALHRNLLHMIYNTTVSALHRPQVLPSAPTPWSSSAATEVQEVSRRKVRQAATEITRLAEELIEFNLVRFLPTTGVTVVLPAVIIHLLDIKSSNAVTRELSLEGFSICMQVLQGLRKSYNAADFATHFLEAAIRKAGIQVDGLQKHASRRRARYRTAIQNQQALAAASSSPVMSMSSNGNNVITIPATAPPSNAALTPPPDLDTVTNPPPPPPPTTTSGIDESDLQLKLENFLQAPPSPQHDDNPLPMDLDSSLPSNLMYGNTPSSRGGGDAISMPGPNSDDDLDTLFSRNIDPFLGHGGDDAAGGSLGMQNRAEATTITKASALGSSWLERSASEDMSRFLDGLEFDIDDVIQVLETEIN